MIILVMGTTGAGKTTVGEMLASRTGWIFLDADDFHPPANIEKMKHGIPLTDADRIPWLEKIHAKLLSISSEGTSAVLACSALKQSYRDQLSAGIDLRIIYLRGTYDQMCRHIEARHGHFAGQSILAGQFADLEEPKNATVLDVSLSLQEIVSAAIEQLHLPQPPRKP